MSLNIVNSFKTAAPLPIAGWVTIGRTVLGSPSTTIDVTGLPNKRYLQFLWNSVNHPSGAETRLRLGNGSFDSANNYANRRSVNGATDVLKVSTDHILLNNNALNEDNSGIGHIANLAGNEKLTQSHMIETIQGAGSVPAREEDVGKWVNTVDTIDQVQLLSGGGSFDTGSELVINAWDPLDEHTDNFWAPLASADLSGGAADNIDTGVFDFKKYLWIQFYGAVNGAETQKNGIRFNGDGGANYAVRASTNGGGESPDPNRIEIPIRAANSANPGFTNMFVTNSSTLDKLVIGHTIERTGAGSGNIPDRREFVASYTDVSNPITSVQSIQRGATGENMGVNTILNVWGSN